MLHEVLLVLAGHDSSFITSENRLLHRSEKALFAQVAALGQINSDVSSRIRWIQQRDSGAEQDKNGWVQGPFPPSTHAVASTIDKLLIVAFNRKLVELENDILSSKSSYVGGDQIVSLSAIVAETVRTWERRFRYAQSLLGFLINSGSVRPCHQLLHRLDKDSITGYDDVKSLVNEIISAVQQTWLQQLSCWAIYGRLPQYSVSQDFMIFSSSVGYDLMMDRVPLNICTEQCARDIYSIGLSLAKLQQNSDNLVDYSHDDTILKQIALPINQAQLSRVIQQLKQHVYRNIVGRKLPLLQIKRFLDVMVRIPLLSSADFGATLVQNQRDKPGLKSSELFRVALAEYVEDYNSHDSDILDYFYLAPVKESNQKLYPDKFDDLLTGTRCKLVLTLEWPLSVLVTEADRQRYSFAFSFLVALKKAHLGVCSLWRIKGADSRLMLVAFKVKLFCDSLWDYAQSSVISNLQQEILDAELTRQHDEKVVDPQATIAKQSQFLTELCRLLWLDNSDIRKLMRSLLTESFVLIESIKSKRGEYSGETIEGLMFQIVESIEQIPEMDSRYNLLLLKLEQLRTS